MINSLNNIFLLSSDVFIASADNGQNLVQKTMTDRQIKGQIKSNSKQKTKKNHEGYLHAPIKNKKQIFVFMINKNGNHWYTNMYCICIDNYKLRVLNIFIYFLNPFAFVFCFVFS